MNDDNSSVSTARRRRDRQVKLARDFDSEHPGAVQYTSLGSSETECACNFRAPGRAQAHTPSRLRNGDREVRPTNQRDLASELQRHIPVQWKSPCQADPKDRAPAPLLTIRGDKSVAMPRYCAAIGPACAVGNRNDSPMMAIPARNIASLERAGHCDGEQCGAQSAGAAAVTTEVLTAIVVGRGRQNSAQSGSSIGLAKLPGTGRLSSRLATLTQGATPEFPE